jgi:hypothetical protein
MALIYGAIFPIVSLREVLIMALRETTTIDRIEILDGGTIAVREVTVIRKDETQIATTYKRWTLEPGNDVSNQPQAVQEVCAQAWTQEVIKNFNNLGKPVPFARFPQ